MRPALPARWPVLAATLLLLAVAAPAPAALIKVDPMDWTGSRSTTAPPGGVTAFNGWNATDGGFRISWEITLSAGVYTYKYTLSDASGGPLTDNEVSHFVLQVSDSFTAADILAGSSSIEDDEPKTYSEGNGNPKMPASLFGLKFDDGGEKPTYTLVTDRDPVWGSFYAKDGGGNGDTAVVAYNTGFTDSSTRPDMGTTNFTNWIPTPDTDEGGGGNLGVPVPPSFVLMGLGGLGLVGLRYRPRRRKG